MGGLCQPSNGPFAIMNAIDIKTQSLWRGEEVKYVCQISARDKRKGKKQYTTNIVCG